jgi:hypothetical protein
MMVVAISAVPQMATSAARSLGRGLSAYAMGGKRERESEGLQVGSPRSSSGSLEHLTKAVAAALMES